MDALNRLRQTKKMGPEARRTHPLASIEAVLVSAEPSRPSQHLNAKQLLLAYLGINPNHPWHASPGHFLLPVRRMSLIRSSLFEVSYRESSSIETYGPLDGWRDKSGCRCPSADPKRLRECSPKVSRDCER